MSLWTQDLNEPSFTHVAGSVLRTGDSSAAPTFLHLFSVFPSLLSHLAASTLLLDRNIKCTFDGGGGDSGERGGSEPRHSILALRIHGKLNVLWVWGKGQAKDAK